MKPGLLGKEQGLFDDIVRNVGGVGETLMTFGSGILAEPLAGWAGILGGDVDRTREKFTYQPRGENAQGRMQQIGEWAEPVMAAGADAAVSIEDMTGIPRELTGAMAQGLMELGPVAKPLARAGRIAATSRTVPATHFSRLRELKTIRADKAGSNPNMNGAEAIRLEQGAPPMSHFYERGIGPEMNLGNYGYRVDVPKVLDLDSRTAKRMRERIQTDLQARNDAAVVGKGFAAQRVQGGEITTELERAVQAAGYGGVRDSQGVVKAFGDVPVKQSTEIAVTRPDPQKIADYAARNPEGFSLDPITGETPRSGYAVAAANTESKIGMAELSPAAVKARMNEMPLDPGQYLGGWQDKGKLVLDNTDVMRNRVPAVVSGRARNQDAIFDFGNFEEIRLDTPEPVRGSPRAQAGYIGSAEGSQLGMIGERRPKARIDQLEEGVQEGRRVSTGSPTPVQAGKTGFHGREDMGVGLEQMRENPKAFKANMDLMKAHALPVAGRSPSAIADQSRDMIAGNLEFLINKAPKEYVDRSSNWYKGANALANDLTNAYGVPIEASAGVLARLSPGMDWLQNVEQADRLISVWSKQKNTPLPAAAFEKMKELNKGDVSRLEGTTLGELKSSKDKARWIRAFDETQGGDNSFKGLTPEGAVTDIQKTKAGAPQQFMWQSNDNISRAIDMLEDSSAENISAGLGRGHKIRNFYNNISQPFHPDDVTIDTHAVSAGLMTPYSQKGVPVGHAFGGGAIPGEVRGSAKSGTAKGTYGLYADAYRDAAERTGLTPQSVQSPTWELIRENFPYSGAQKSALRREIDPVWDSVRRREITPTEAREQILNITTGGKGLKLPEWYE